MERPVRPEERARRATGGLSGRESPIRQNRLTQYRNYTRNGRTRLFRFEQDRNLPVERPTAISARRPAHQRRLDSAAARYPAASLILGGFAMGSLAIWLGAPRLISVLKAGCDLRF